jgi:predicted  nucleic acid-binding Zn-ribbon protein
VPTYESIDLLRKARSNKTLDGQDYANLKKDIFEKGKDIQQVRRDLTTLMKQRKEIDSEEEKQRTRVITVKRFLSTLRSMKREIEISHLLPPSILKETESLIRKLEAEIS